jgi:hypothetical protein
MAKGVSKTKGLDYVQAERSVGKEWDAQRRMYGSDLRVKKPSGDIVDIPNSPRKGISVESVSSRNTSISLQKLANAEKNRERATTAKERIREQQEQHQINRRKQENLK